MLQMFNGNELVDTVRLTGGQGLQLEQNSSGVMLTLSADVCPTGRSWDHYHCISHSLLREPRGLSEEARAGRTPQKCGLESDSKGMPKNVR